MASWDLYLVFSSELQAVWQLSNLRLLCSSLCIKYWTVHTGLCSVGNRAEAALAGESSGSRRRGRACSTYMQGAPGTWGPQRTTKILSVTCGGRALEENKKALCSRHRLMIFCFYTSPAFGTMFFVPTQGSPGLRVFTDTSKDTHHGGPQSGQIRGRDLICRL